MILRPDLDDIKPIGYYLGEIILGLGLVMFLPFAAGVFLFGEFEPALHFIIGGELALLIGILLKWACSSPVKDMNMAQGMVVVSLSWLAAMAFGALPLVLSGHYKSFLDACFETMSGFTTTGLTLVQDLDHMALTHNLWRHMTHFIGGQGIAIVALAFFMIGGGGALRMYVGEAREEKIVPNVIQTARIIWMISIVYLVIGTLALALAGMHIGLRPGSAFFHGICVFMAGFDTAGFTPQSQSILYYHSLLYEIITIVIMIFGTMNFNLHYQLWKGNFRELWKNIETRTFVLSVASISFIVMLGLGRLGVYSHALSFFRKGFYQLISGHSGTGYMTIYAKQFINEWGDIALVGIIIAMGLGGCICSTAGGIKMLRVGLFFKALREDVKRIMVPENAVVTQKFHHIKTLFLDNKQVRAILMITLLYIILYAFGSLVGVLYNYPFLNSLFESTSAGANVGLSCGITDASMPALLKITYMLQMWVGRLEMIAIFGLIAFIASFFRGK